jgi:hypothetical protein
MTIEVEQPIINKKPIGLITMLMVVIVILVAATIILAISNSNYKQEVKGLQNITLNITEAFNIGIVASLSEIMRVTDNCKIATIKYTNRSKELVDMECIKPLLQQLNMSIQSTPN